MNEASECVKIARNGEHIYAFGQFNGSSVTVGKHTYGSDASAALHYSAAFMLQIRSGYFTQQVLEMVMVTPMNDGWVNVIDAADSGSNFFLTGTFWGTVIIGASSATKTIASESPLAFLILIDHHITTAPAYYAFSASSDRKNTLPVTVHHLNDTTAYVAGTELSIVGGSSGNSWRSTAFLARFDLQDGLLKRTYHKRFLANSIDSVTHVKSPIPVRRLCSERESTLADTRARSAPMGWCVCGGVL